MPTLFSKMLCRLILSSHVYQASPRRGRVSHGYLVAPMNACSSLLRRSQLQSKSLVDVGKLDIYLMVSFTTRCCASARVLVLLFLGVILQQPSYQTFLHKSMRHFAQKVQPTLMVNGLLSLAVLLTTKLQPPHLRAGFGVDPNVGIAIFAFYATSVSLMQWLGFCSHCEQNSVDLASTWGPGSDSANLDLWTPPI